MGPKLNGLIKLQGVENRLRALKGKLARCRRKVIVQENRIRTLQNAYQAKKEEIQLTKIQSDRLELELKSRDETVVKLRASLNAARTNKEYAAVLTQLNTSKADTSKIESQVLDLLKDVEADEDECAEMQVQTDEQKKILEQIRKDTEVRVKDYQEQIEQIQQEWEHVAESLPAESLELFKRVAETYDGEALAVVEQQEGKNKSYSCGGCFMGIPAESVNLLMTRDDIIHCPNCTRILVLGKSPD